MKKLIISCILAVSLGSLGGVSQSKPMPSASLEEGVRTTQVYLCSFEGLQSGAKADYFSGVVCSYKVLKTAYEPFGERTRVLENGKTIKVRYHFDDGSACLAPKDWRFNKAMLPVKGSRWFLFIKKSPVEGVYATYRGSYGRKAYSKSLEAKILKASRALGHTQ